jgi:hypothetical protein
MAMWQSGMRSPDFCRSGFPMMTVINAVKMAIGVVNAWEMLMALPAEW